LKADKQQPLLFSPPISLLCEIIQMSNEITDTKAFVFWGTLVPGQLPAFPGHE